MGVVNRQTGVGDQSAMKKVKVDKQNDPELETVREQQTAQVIDWKTMSLDRGWKCLKGNCLDCGGSCVLRPFRYEEEDSRLPLRLPEWYRCDNFCSVRGGRCQWITHVGFQLVRGKLSNKVMYCWSADKNWNKTEEDAWLDDIPDRNDVRRGGSFGGTNGSDERFRRRGRLKFME